LQTKQTSELRSTSGPEFWIYQYHHQGVEKCVLFLIFFD